MVGTVNNFWTKCIRYSSNFQTGYVLRKLMFANPQVGLSAPSVSKAQENRTYRSGDGSPCEGHLSGSIGIPWNPNFIISRSMVYSGSLYAMLRFRGDLGCASRRMGLVHPVKMLLYGWSRHCKRLHVYLSYRFNTAMLDANKVEWQSSDFRQNATVCNSCEC